MSANKFKFVSPGVFVDEIDNSQLNQNSNDVGPVVIGRSERGPALTPIKVNSFSEFVEIFGNPIPGGVGGDVFRDGNYVGPTYGPYAAQAYLKNASPVTFIRLLGKQNTNATSAGKAGWQTTDTTPSTTLAQNGGAFGLFIAPSSSDFSSSPTTGTLAAIFYVDASASIGLSGSDISGAASAPATSKYIQSLNSTPTFKIAITNSSGVVLDSQFNFTSTSDMFIRKVFNTNPILCNSSVTTTTQSYWLGSTFEANVAQLATASTYVGVILPLMSGSEVGADFRKSYQEAKTGWFIAQDLTTNTGSFNAVSQQQLFRFVGRNSGEWLQKNLKVSISDIKRSTDQTNDFGSFSVVIRKMSDTDSKVEIVEQFNNLNLNPASENYIAKRIGNKYLTWDDTTRRYTEYGDYDNLSKFIRVEMNVDVDGGNTNPQYLPFGFLGPVVFKDFTDSSAGSSFVSGAINTYDGTNFTQFISGNTAGQILFKFPSVRLKVSGSENNIADFKRSYFGADTTFNSGRLADSVPDTLRVKPGSVDDWSLGNSTKYAFVFTLDDISSSSGVSVYSSGSRAAGTSYRGTGSYALILETLGADKFTAVFNGAFDGLDIKEKEPFNNADLASKTELTQYSFNTIKMAIDMCRDPEEVEFDAICIPGITHQGLTTALTDMVESRRDAFAILDIAGDYTPETENTQTIENRIGSVDTAVSNIRSYGWNTNYGGVFYPWVQAKDTITGATLWVPPSVVVLGTFGYTKRVAQVWFAPAGFTRGGLSNGAGGIPVVGVRQRLSKVDRDKLYDAKINPIAKFPNEGIVVFGQKTLQAVPSALDRINVRRLVNAIKKQLSRFAATTLFEPNVQATWNSFRSRAEPYLDSVKTNFGLDDYKLVLDETTTTSDLIDRNAIYAKLYLKPTKTAEFFLLDVNISSSGASFED